MKATLAVINQMLSDGVIGRYAIGGAVGATFYLEPSATLDIDIFVSPSKPAGSSLLSLSPIYDHLKSRGCEIRGEYIIIENWQVQFLPPADALGEEAVAQAVETKVDDVVTWVMTAEHLVALALQTGRAKDHLRVLQFVESGALDAEKLDAILKRHGLLAKWEDFGNKFMRNKP